MLHCDSLDRATAIDSNRRCKFSNLYKSVHNLRQVLKIDGYNLGFHQKSRGAIPPLAPLWRRPSWINMHFCGRNGGSAGDFGILMHVFYKGCDAPRLLALDFASSCSLSSARS